MEKTIEQQISDLESHIHYHMHKVFNALAIGIKEDIEKNTTMTVIYGNKKETGDNIKAALTSEYTPKDKNDYNTNKVKLDELLNKYKNASALKTIIEENFK